MGVFDNEKYYNVEQFNEMYFKDQRDVFLKIRSWVATVDKETRYNSDKYHKVILKKIEQVCSYACEGHIPSQDYMGYIYKRGFANIFPINFKRSLEWNILAASNGSKLAPEKMRAFLNPAIDMIFGSARIGQIIKYNELTRENYFCFLSQYVCDILKVEMQISVAEIAKRKLVEEDLNESATWIYLDRLRDRAVRKAIENLIKELPDNMPDVSEAFEDEENSISFNDDIDDIDTNIEDIK